MKTQADAALLAQLQQQVQDLRLHRHVEARDDLVGDQQPRRDAQRPRDVDALLLPAGELRGIAVEQIGRQAGFREQRAGAGHALGFAGAGTPDASSDCVMRRPTGRRGFSADCGSWNTICSVPSLTLRAAGSLTLTSLPSMAMRPVVSGSSPMTSLATVLLPDPDFADDADELAGAHGEVHGLHGIRAGPPPAEPVAFAGIVLRHTLQRQHDVARRRRRATGAARPR